jgi:hypothetical protein
MVLVGIVVRRLEDEKNSKIHAEWSLSWHGKVIKRHIQLHGKHRFFRLEFNFYAALSRRLPTVDTIP